MQTPRSALREPARALSRRQALAFMGASGAMLLAGLKPQAACAQASDAARAVPACVARPEQTEGPYFVEEALDRFDIRSDPGSGEVKAGVPLQLVFNVSRVTGTSCEPLPGAQVDLWHCDATGRYSDVAGFGVRSSTARQRFLRGYQYTDPAGSARFLTIVPGWYGGRAVHLHFKIRHPSASATSYAFTSQLYFDEALLEQVYAQEPYASRGRRWMRNGEDGIFRDGGGQLLLAAEANGTGYAASFAVGLQV